MIKMFVSGIPILLQSRQLTTVSFTPRLFNRKEITEHPLESAGSNNSNNGHERDLKGKKKKIKKIL